MDATTTLVFGIPAIGLVLAVTQLAKQYINSKFAPLVSVCFGLLLVVLANLSHITPEVIVNGIVVGLLASGTYSSTKSLIGQ